MTVEAKVKKWGNSLGIILPSAFVESRHVTENDTVVLTVVKKVDVSKLFGSLKKAKLSGQAFKDVVKAGWN